MPPLAINTIVDLTSLWKPIFLKTAATP